MALHEQCVGATDEWYTPPYIFEAMGCRFDLDVASPGLGVVPWIPVDRHITADSLNQKWDGFIWMNAPFGARNGLVPWLDKFFAHGNGIALTPDRTSAPWWQKFAPQSDLILVVGKKIRFINADGFEGTSPAQGTTLLAIGPRGVEALTRASAHGLGSLFRPVQ